MRISDWSSDMCSSDLIELHRRAGKPIPPGWGIDAEGAPTTDAEAALAGAMLTFGGHKGSALATMVELIARSEEHTSELQSLMRISYAVFCLKKKKRTKSHEQQTTLYAEV